MKLTTSPRLEEMLQNMSIHSYLDVLDHLPRRYDNFTYTDSKCLSFLEDKQKVVLLGRILTKPRVQKFQRASVAKFYFREEKTHRDFAIEAWNRPYLAGNIELDSLYSLQGSYDRNGHCLNLILLRKGIIKPEDSIVPIYSLPKDYPEHSWRQLVKKALEAEKESLPDFLPSYLRQKYRLVSRQEAYALCHFPSSMEDVRQGTRLLKYEEALLFSLKNQWIRSQNKALVRHSRKTIDFKKVGDFIRSLPFSLTDDQKKALRDGLEDMNSNRLMYRLLQGDVGTGKTLVAALMLYGNYLRGEQGALLAPTDSLARQHYETLQSLFQKEGIRVGLLVGGLSAKEHREMLEKCQKGEVDIVVGTHALFAEKVRYGNLGFVVMDEQHKFGVNQRAALADKGEHADVLLMSATPIPRTLSLTLYGDLDVSILSSFPARKREVTTKIVKPDSMEMKKRIAASLTSGHRVYVVAPQIEGGEEEDSSVLSVYHRYESAYPGLVGLLHGQMNSEEKAKAIEDFKNGETPILISTSVIEVGIDVKAANLMIIYEPTHFALSSLHQLRGRIGRDGSPSVCYLVYGHSIQEDLDKLKVLVDTEDGFKIAEEDLKRRGPGELAGVKQSGLPDFHFANIVTDFKMFECARDDAVEIFARRDEKELRPLLERAYKMSQGISLA